MNAWKGRVALVTGASAGIGAAIVRDLVKSGVTVVGAARRVQVLEEMAEKLEGEQGRLVPRQLDIAKPEEIAETYQWIESELGGADIVINNAGYMGTASIPDTDDEELRKHYNINVVGTTVSCREALKSMVRRGMKTGHIININSTLGHHVPSMHGANFGVYPATKYAITATCKLLRNEVLSLGLNTRITSISPGLVKTDLSGHVRSKFEGVPALNPEDIARAVHYVLEVPPSVEITELTIQPTNEAI